MKNLLLLVAFVSFATFSMAQTQTTVPDFRDISWGTHKDSVVIDGRNINFVEVEEGPDPNSYRIPNDNMKIGTVKLEKLHYIFNGDGRFKKVFVTAPRQYLEDMEFILGYKFGEPSKVRRLGYVTIKDWKIGDVVFTLSEFSNREFFSLTIESNWEYSAKRRENMNVKDF